MSLLDPSGAALIACLRYQKNACGVGTLGSSRNVACSSYMAVSPLLHGLSSWIWGGPRFVGGFGPLDSSSARVPSVEQIEGGAHGQRLEETCVMPPEFCTPLISCQDLLSHGGCGVHSWYLEACISEVSCLTRLQHGEARATIYRSSCRFTESQVSQKFFVIVYVLVHEDLCYCLYCYQCR